MAPRRPHLHAPWGAWPLPLINIFVLLPFQLTRSVGSVTFTFTLVFAVFCISTHTLRGERDFKFFGWFVVQIISTHTLRGERDTTHRIAKKQFKISTHTLRGERDLFCLHFLPFCTISTHTLRGERDWRKDVWQDLQLQFQLTRSVGSVTWYFKSFPIFT